MQPVTARMHALLARELIAACGGLDEAAGACRLKKTRLAECQDPEANAYLPIDVVGALEAYCGRPIYTRPLADAHAGVPGEDLVAEACEVTEGAAALQRLVRQLKARKRPFTPRERHGLDSAVLRLMRELDEVLVTADGEGGA